MDILHLKTLKSGKKIIENKRNELNDDPDPLTYAFRTRFAIIRYQIEFLLNKSISNMTIDLFFPAS